MSLKVDERVRFVGAFRHGAMVKEDFGVERGDVVVQCTLRFKRGQTHFAAENDLVGVGEDLEIILARVQVWSLTQFYSHNQGSEKKVCFKQTHNQGLRKLSFDGVMVPLRLV